MMHEYVIKYRMSQWESCFGTKRAESRFKRMAVACSDEDRQTPRELREMAMLTHRLSFSGSWFPKGNQSWISIRRTEADTEAPMLWPPDAKSWLIRKDTGAGKEWRQEEKGTPEDELVVWHHQKEPDEIKEQKSQCEWNRVRKEKRNM